MFEFIEKLRAKSSRGKKQIAFLTAFSISGAIFVIWLVAVYPDFISTKLKQDNAKKLEPSPLSAFEDTLASSFSALGEEIGQLKESIKLFSVTAEHYSTTSSDASETFSGE